jgi:polyhydroxybutyrate depolymerase
LLLAAASAFSLAACSSGTGLGVSGSTTSSTGSGGVASGCVPAPGADAGPIGGDRPVALHVPPSYDGCTPVPLVMMLHGYSATAEEEELYLNITAQADTRGFIYAKPDGTVDKLGNQFWNADDACCDLYDVPVDDSTYLSSVLTQVQGLYNVDKKRVYVMGHSNGGFMAYRMACDHADQIAAIVSLAGAMPTDPSVCKPSQPVATLEIHGTADMVIAYDGGSIQHAIPATMVPYPGATTTVSDWVSLDGCSTTPDTTAPPLDLDSSLPGDETSVTKYAGGCKTGGHVELWSIAGGSHIPDVSTAFTPDFIQFFYDHPRP